MMENGSSGGAGPLPFSGSHDAFLKLCALSTTDSLSAEEKERLSRHLAGCADCREALAQYQALIGAGVPAAALNGTPTDDLDDDPDWSLEEAEARLLARLDSEEKAVDADSPKPPMVPSPAMVPSFNGLRISESPVPGADSLWKHLWLQSAAAMLLVIALGFTAFRIGMERGARTEQIAAKVRMSAPSPVANGSTTESSDALARAEAAVRSDNRELAALDVLVKRRTEEIAALKAQNRQAQSDLGGALATQAGLQQARDNIARQLTEAESDLDQVRRRLDAVSAANARDTVDVMALRRQVNEQNSSLAERDQELARAQALLDHDQDIRDLMGSRNLYIAEVYDVARNGQTKKPFGRVFYTKGKSLIFYAYDLDQRPGVRDSSTFQAWGSRGQARSSAVSLGIFYQDSAAKKCWVLKAADPKVLSGIDAVFVTVEPHGGSIHPSGKPLLYAYLHIEPNHP